MQHWQQPNRQAEMQHWQQPNRQNSALVLAKPNYGSRIQELQPNGVLGLQLRNHEEHTTQPKARTLASWVGTCGVMTSEEAAVVSLSLSRPLPNPTPLFVFAVEVG